MIPVRNKKAETIYQALYDLKGRNDGFFNDLFKSITFDNGSEFSKWKDMEANLGFKTYFGRPYHSGDRGSNENCNGLIRRFIKKGTDINTIELSYTLMINRAINAKRRRKFGFKSANEMFQDELRILKIKDTYLYHRKIS